VIIARPCVAGSCSIQLNATRDFDFAGWSSGSKAMYCVE
jgi:hypothetical protein